MNYDSELGKRNAQVVLALMSAYRPMYARHLEDDLPEGFEFELDDPRSAWHAEKCIAKMMEL